MIKAGAMEALNNLNTEWQEKGHPYAQESDSGWTMTCPSCSIAVGDGKISLVEALNQAIRHRQGCQSVPAES